jgi:hypothetical protein
VDLGFPFHSLAQQTIVFVIAGASIGGFFGGIGGNRLRWTLPLAGCVIGVLIGAYLVWWQMMSWASC